MDEFAALREPHRDPAALLARTRAQWGGRSDLWVFAYASLIWNPGLDIAEQRPARVFGHHRALQMWSRVNRGSPDQPGLVFALLAGGSCRGLALRVPRAQADQALQTLWEREMPTCVYDPQWLRCHTPAAVVPALAFVLPANSPSRCGLLDPQAYRQIFARACGRYGSTLDYARNTLHSLQALGIQDRALERLLAHGCAPATTPAASGPVADPHPTGRRSRTPGH